MENLTKILESESDNSNLFDLNKDIDYLSIFNNVIIYGGVVIGGISSLIGTYKLIEFYFSK